MPSEIQQENSTLTPELPLFSKSILKQQLSFTFPFVSKTLEIDFKFILSTAFSAAYQMH